VVRSRTQHVPRRHRGPARAFPHTALRHVAPHLTLRHSSRRRLLCARFSAGRLRRVLLPFRLRQDRRVVLGAAARTATHGPAVHNCAVCARREEEQIEGHGRIVRRDAGNVVGVAVHGTTFHIGDYALVRAEAGPSRIAQLVGVFSSDPVWVKLQLLGRVSDLADLLPPDELRDEVRLSACTCHCYVP
jgi:hypothetical protein